MSDFISPLQKLQITYLEIYSYNIYSRVYEKQKLKLLINERPS